MNALSVNEVKHIALASNEASGPILGPLCSFPYEEKLQLASGC